MLSKKVLKNAILMLSKKKCIKIHNNAMKKVLKMLF